VKRVDESSPQTAPPRRSGLTAADASARPEEGLFLLESLLSTAQVAVAFVDRDFRFIESMKPARR
jgi:hypothetical protein